MVLALCGKGGGTLLSSVWLFDSQTLVLADSQPEQKTLRAHMGTTE